MESDYERALLDLPSLAEVKSLMASDCPDDVRKGVSMAHLLFHALVDAVCDGDASEDVIHALSYLREKLSPMATCPEVVNMVVDVYVSDNIVQMAAGALRQVTPEPSASATRCLEEVVSGLFANVLNVGVTRGLDLAYGPGAGIVRNSVLFVEKALKACDTTNVEDIDRLRAVLDFVRAHETPALENTSYYEKASAIWPDAPWPTGDDEL